MKSSASRRLKFDLKGTYEAQLTRKLNNNKKKKHLKDNSYPSI